MAARRSAACRRRWTTPTTATWAAIKFPYRWTFAWLDGRDNFEFSDVKLNVPIDAAKFGRAELLPRPEIARAGCGSRVGCSWLFGVLRQLSQPSRQQAPLAPPTSDAAFSQLLRGANR